VLCYERRECAKCAAAPTVCDIVASHVARKFFRQVETAEQRDGAQNSERTIEQPPLERDVPEVSANERERNHGAAGNKSTSKHPGIADRVAKRSDEKQRDDEMTEGQPVGAVANKWKSSVGFLETEKDEGEPTLKPGKVS
jgi:hypothetical protein